MTEIRILDKEELLHASLLSQYAFQYELTDEEVKERIEQQKDITVLGIFEGEQLASKLQIIPLAIYINEQVYSMGGIAGVATWPEFRRKKHVSTLITNALKIMKEKKQLVSFLHPFKISFYRKFGWDLYCERANLEISKSDLVPFSMTHGVIKRVAKEEAFATLSIIYETYAKQYNGMLKRTENWWTHRVYSKDSHFIVYIDEQNQPAGYLHYKMKDTVMDIKEMVYLHEEARRGLWNFICQHDSMADKVRILTSTEDKLPYLLQNPFIKKDITPYFMGRIVDVLPFLQSYPFHTYESLFLHVYDQYAPWNNGTYYLNNGDITFYQKEQEGSICVHPPKRGIQLDISTLSSLLIGNQRPTFLYEAGKISGSKDDVDRLEKMVPNRSGFFLDFF